jgi:hypothetical protein
MRGIADMSDVKFKALASDETSSRREAMKRVARFCAVSAPAVTLILAASSKPAKAVVS